MGRHPRITGSGKKLVRVWLDDGSYLDTTPDHGFLRLDGSKVEALNHPFYGPIYQFLRFLGFNIVFFYLSEHFSEDFNILVNLFSISFDFGAIAWGFIPRLLTPRRGVWGIRLSPESPRRAA